MISKQGHNLGNYLGILKSLSFAQLYNVFSKVCVLALEAFELKFLINKI